MASSNLLVYGCYGYTGALITRRAVDQGLSPILGGRNPERISQLATQFGLDFRIFALDDPAAIEGALNDVAVVLNCAGPFSHTAKPIVDACMRTGTSYLDITGEIGVFEALAARDDEAKSAGIMLLPGLGFDVVPSDCLVAHLKKRLPTATHLTLGIRALSKMSRGTSTTMIEGIGRGGMTRRDGALVSVPAAWKNKMIDFGRGLVTTVLVPWADLATAYYSTSIPNIEVYLTLPASLRRTLVLSRYLGWILRFGPVQSYLKRQVQRQPAGPTDEERASGLSLIWGEVKDDAGHQASSMLKTPESYELTALTAVAAARKVLSGSSPRGFQTPSLAFGEGFILEFQGVELSDF
jgi:short subunit dehydrogenase-like uncharacterized protein